MTLETVGSYKDEPLVNALQDLAVRFIINCPPEDLESSERLFFQIEEAQWFYEDFVRVENPSLPSMKLKTFVERLFQACPILEVFSADTYADLGKFQSYKSIIPVRGAIILNKKMTKALMVKGWKQGASWGFPRGKINKDERDDLCAIREVYEEIGYDISPFLVQEDYIEVTIRQKNIRLYIIRGVPSNTAFKPQTRKEISKIEWHDVGKLPAYARNPKTNSQWDYFMVAPFMPGLSKYIKKLRGEKSSLSKKEAKALKSLLGVGAGEPSAAEDSKAPAAEITDASAEELLRLIKTGSTDEKPSGSEDRKMLLDLINEKKEGGDDLSNARELLSMLQTEMHHDIGMAQPMPVPPMPPMQGGQWPMGVVPPPLPPPPMGLPLGMPPIPPPPMPWGIPPPPPPPLPGTQWPMAPPPVPQRQHHGHATTVNVAEDGRDSLISYNAPPPPPPNPVLMSLLQKRKTKGKNDDRDEKAVDHRFESYRSLKKKTTTDFSDVGGGKNALLSLLGNPQPAPQAATNPQGNSNNNGSGKDDLMKLLKGHTEPENELMSLLKSNAPAEPPKQTDRNALMDLLNPPKEEEPKAIQEEPKAPIKEDDGGADLMKLLRGEARTDDNSTAAPAQGPSESSKDLMGLLRKSPKPDNPPPSVESTAKTDLMSLLNPGKPAPPQNGGLSAEQNSDGNDLMKLLLKPQEETTGASAPKETTHSSLPRQRRSSAGSSLMDLLDPRSNAKHRAEEINLGPAKPAATANNNSSSELMSLLNIGGGSPSSPKSMQDKTVAEPLAAANGEPSHYRQDRAPPAASSQRAVDLMGLLNGSKDGNSAAVKSASVATSSPPATAAPASSASSGKRNSSGAQSLMALLDPTSASSGLKSSGMSSADAVGNTDTSSHAVHIPKEENRSAASQAKQGTLSTDAEDPMAKFLRDFSNGRI